MFQPRDPKPSPDVRPEDLGGAGVTREVDLEVAAGSMHDRIPIPHVPARWCPLRGTADAVPDAAEGAVDVIEHQTGRDYRLKVPSYSVFHTSPVRSQVSCWKAHPDVVSDAVVGAVDVVEHLAGQRVLVEEQAQELDPLSPVQNACIQHMRLLGSRCRVAAVRRQM